MIMMNILMRTDDDGSDLRCSEYTPYACSQEGEMMFRDPNGNDVQITEECCNDLGIHIRRKRINR